MRREKGGLGGDHLEHIIIWTSTAENVAVDSGVAAIVRASPSTSKYQVNKWLAYGRSLSSDCLRRRVE